MVIIKSAEKGEIDFVSGKEGYLIKIISQVQGIRQLRV